MEADVRRPLIHFGRLAGPCAPSRGGEIALPIPEAHMNPHESDLETGDRREPLRRPEHPAPDDRPRDDREIGKEVDKDHDGLPDEPARFRVPS
jgi:hypothetical protein